MRAPPRTRPPRARSGALTPALLAADRLAAASDARGAQLYRYGSFSYLDGSHFCQGEEGEPCAAERRLDSLGRSRKAPRIGGGSAHAGADGGGGHLAELVSAMRSVQRQHADELMRAGDLEGYDAVSAVLMPYDDATSLAPLGCPAQSDAARPAPGAQLHTAPASRSGRREPSAKRAVAAAQDDDRRLYTTSEYLGVTWSGRLSTTARPWRAKIYVDGRTVHLGCFETEDEAAHAYDAAAVHFDKRTNFEADTDDA